MPTKAKFKFPHVAEPQRVLRSASVRSLEILFLIARSPSPLKLDDIASVTTIPKPTAFRLLHTLVNAKILLRDAPSKSYSPSSRLTDFALSILENSSNKGARRIILQGLVDTIGETCNFTTLDGSEVVYIDRVESGWPLRLHLQPGSRVPLHCTSSGKIFLSEMTVGHRRRILRSKLKRYTPRTIVDQRLLEIELRRIRRLGYSMDNEGFLTGLISIAVPVFDRNGRVFAAVAVHAPTARLTLRQAQNHLPLLRNAAKKLGALYR